MSIQFNKAHETLSAFERNVPILGVVGSVAQILVTIAEIFAKNVLHMDIASYNDPKDYLKYSSINILSGGLLLPILKVLFSCGAISTKEPKQDLYEYQIQDEMVKLTHEEKFSDIPYTEFVDSKKVLSNSTFTHQKLFQELHQEAISSQMHTNPKPPVYFGTTTDVNDRLKQLEEFQNEPAKSTQEDRVQAVPYTEL